MGKATNPRSPNRSKGGRPRQDGARYPSGKLRPAQPNSKVVETRKAFGLDKLGQKFTPIEVAFHHGWIDEETYWAAARFAALHRLAVTDGPVFANQNLPEAPTGVSVRDLSFAQLTDAEVSAIWDSAMGEHRTETPDERRARATERWRAVAAVMTTAQLREVTDVVVLDSWPQWIIHRAAGRITPHWETKRNLLIDGLGTMATHRRRAA